MSKSLKGKECGTGIGQRKDGRFYARFVSKHGKRHGKYFSVLAEARNCLEDARCADRHDNMFAPADIILDIWVEYWLDNIAMGTMLKSALMNDLIAKHPMNGVRYTKPVCAA